MTVTPSIRRPVIYIVGSTSDDAKLFAAGQQDAIDDLCPPNTAPQYVLVSRPDVVRGLRIVPERIVFTPAAFRNPDIEAIRQALAVCIHASGVGSPLIQNRGGW